VSPEAVEAALAAAEQYLTSSDVPRAEAILRRLIEQVPGESRARELYGRVLSLKALQAREQGHSAVGDRVAAEAYEQYRQAVELAPGSSGLHQSAGEVASVAGLDDVALGHFEAAARLDPASSKHSLYAAQVLIRQGRLDEADAALERVLALDPDEPFGYASQGAVALERGDCDRALARTAEARRIEPGRLGFRVQEAKIRRRCGQPVIALELLATLGDRQRAEEAVVYEIAASYGVLGEHRKAAEAWLHRYRSHPSSWLAAVRAAGAFLEAGDRAEAKQWIQRAEAAAGSTPEVRAVEEALSRAPEGS
jgi:tetratricopeptide (TPR) repeat protein